jgi:hypothetical protein
MRIAKLLVVVVVVVGGGGGGGGGGARSLKGVSHEGKSELP